MRIKKITKLKSGKYKMEFDNNTKIITYDNILIENNILFKKEIDDELYNKLYNETLDYNLYSRVLKYTLIKMRSLKEIKKYMNKLEINEEEQNKIVSKLQENNFINDNKFAEAFIADKINLSSSGPNKIKKELLEHDVNIDVIDEYLSKYDYEIFKEKIDKIIQKKIVNNNKSEYILKSKLTNYLLDLGYDLDMIKECLSKLKIDCSNALEKEYNKLFRKLQSKFDKEELEKQIKNKLYQKGYNLSEINEFLSTK